jgi:hypothetical protein
LRNSERTLASKRILDGQRKVGDLDRVASIWPPAPPAVINGNAERFGQAIIAALVRTWSMASMT